MSVNFSQNPEYINAQNNFGSGGITTEDVTPAQVEILKSMDLPTTPKEVLTYAPCFIGAYAGSKLLSNAAIKGASLNPLKPGLENITVADSFDKSKVSALTSKIDDCLNPIIQKHSAQINSARTFISKYTPNWVKNLIEKVQIGVRPLNKLALDQYKGMTARAAEQALSSLKSVGPEKLSSLGLSEIITDFNANRLTARAAIEAVVGKLKNIPAKEIQTLTTQAGKKLTVLEELNTARAFIGNNAKTSATKGLQRGIMAVSEAAGGGVIGNSIFGILMNSIFLASTIKRTWNAPWGEKLSTFMEGALVDFCGGYLMALLGTRITYKLSGVKNVDKTAEELLRIKQVTKDIGTQKLAHKELSNLLKAAKNGSLSGELLDKAISFGLKPNATAQEAIEFLSSRHLNSANTINSTIDNLAKMRKLQDRGFFKNLINRPIRWIGNFFSTGLENLPAKVHDGKALTALKIGLRKLTNGFKFCAGYPIRFFLVLMVVTPPLTKLCAKISHTLFGKPTKSIMDEREGKKTEPKQTTQEQNPYHIDMNTFSEYTKATGAQNKTQLAQLQPKMSATFVDSAIKLQKKRMEIDKNDISPAIYVPSTNPTDFSNPVAKKLVEEQSAKADKVEKYAKDRMIKLQK